MGRNAGQALTRLFGTGMTRALVVDIRVIVGLTTRLSKHVRGLSACVTA